MDRTETSERLNSGMVWRTRPPGCHRTGQYPVTLQLANYIATLVNGGNHYPAHLLQTGQEQRLPQVVLENEPEPWIPSTSVRRTRGGQVRHVPAGTEGSVSKHF